MAIIIEGRTTRKAFRPSEDHTKYINKDGENIPSSTTILKILSKDSLVYWANNLGWHRKSVSGELETSSIIGTLTHGLIEQIMRGEKIDLQPVELYGGEIYEKVVTCLTSFIKWWKPRKDDIEVLYQEHEMSSDLYGGTADLVCNYKGKKYIIDFKTSKSIYYSMFLQLVSYVRLYEYNHDDKIEEVAILRLDKKHGDEAQFMNMKDVIKKSGYEDMYSVREMIDEYTKTFMKAVSLFYDINDISTEWS